MVKKLSRKELMSLLDYDPESGEFTWSTARNGVKQWKVAGTINFHGYVKIAINRRAYSAHILAILFIQGYWPISIVDHKNRDRADNRICNLRVTSQRVNSRNAKVYKNNKSGVSGVSWNKRSKKWQVLITTTKRISLGLFPCFFDAVCARKSAELRHEYFTYVDF